jgi:hypothetical protein
MIMKQSCKVMTLDEKINILDRLHGDMKAGAPGLTFHFYLPVKSNLLLIFCFNV